MGGDQHAEGRGRPGGQAGGTETAGGRQHHTEEESVGLPQTDQHSPADHTDEYPRPEWQHAPWTGRIRQGAWCDVSRSVEVYGVLNQATTEGHAFGLVSP